MEWVYYVHSIIAKIIITPTTNFCVKYNESKVMILQSGTAEVELKKGNMIKITLDDAYMDNCSEQLIWLDYKNIVKVVEIGSKIYIDDGLISLQVKEIGEWRNDPHS